MNPTKAIKFFRHSADVRFIPTFTQIDTSIQLYAQPLRVTPTLEAGILLHKKVYTLFLDDSDRFVIVGNYASFQEDHCQLLDLDTKFSLKYLIAPPKNIENPVIKTCLKQNQHGTYIYCDGSDEEVESLVEYFISKTPFNVLAWDEHGAEPIDRHVFNWYILLSSGLSVEKIAQVISEYISKREASFLLERKNFFLDRDAEATMLSEEITLISRENELLKDKLVDYSERLQKQLTFASNCDLGTRQRVADLKKSKAEKILAMILCHAFSNLAFPPHTPALILERFYDSSSLWSVLDKLNRGISIPKQALYGIAGKQGWSELNLHLNTGCDSRGRMYVRKSRGNHAFDVVLHWKKDNHEQNRLMKVLASYKPFKSHREVMG